MRSPSETALEHLLYPIKPAEFFREYWGKRPLYIPGARDKFDEIIERPLPDSRRLARDGMRVAMRLRDGTDFVCPIAPHQADGLLAAGGTVISELEGTDARLDAFMSKLRAQGNFIGRHTMACFESGDREGVIVHFDATQAFFLQFEGLQALEVLPRGRDPAPGGGHQVRRQGRHAQHPGRRAARSAR